jgi:hypothetical protein
VGVFIDPAAVVAQHPRPDRVLFVNPTLEKGAAVVCRMAMLLERRRPDIVFEVVEARGKWEDIVQMVTAAFGEPRDSLSNVVVTPNTVDMRPLYGRARCLLVPTLWWESAGRVIVEAMLNGIPAIVSNRGGPPEMLGEGGLRIEFPPACYQPPFTSFPATGFSNRSSRRSWRFRRSRLPRPFFEPRPPFGRNETRYSPQYRCPGAGIRGACRPAHGQCRVNPWTELHICVIRQANNMWERGRLAMGGMVEPIEGDTIEDARARRR